MRNEERQHKRQRREHDLRWNLRERWTRTGDLFALRALVARLISRMARAAPFQVDSMHLSDDRVARDAIAGFCGDDAGRHTLRPKAAQCFGGFGCPSHFTPISGTIDGDAAAILRELSNQ